MREQGRFLHPLYDDKTVYKRTITAAIPRDRRLDLPSLSLPPFQTFGWYSKKTWLELRELGAPVAGNRRHRIFGGPVVQDLGGGEPKNRTCPSHTSHADRLRNLPFSSLPVNKAPSSPPVEPTCRIKPMRGTPRDATPHRERSRWEDCESSAATERPQE